MPDLVVKTFRGFEIKDAEKGEVSAKVAQLEIKDKDGDLIRKGAQPKAAKVAMSSWGHDAVFGSRPAGKGTLKSTGNDLMFDGRVFLNTADGRDTFEVLKEMGEDQEWSFAFRVLGSELPSEDERKQGITRVITKMDAFEVSPVLIGAGIGTQTTSIKAAAQADGDPAVEPTDDLKAIGARVVKEMADRLEAERKAAAAAAAEAVRIEAETKAAAEAKAEAERKSAELAVVQPIFERFRRTMTKLA
jgi:hypothetical protein